MLVDFFSAPARDTLGLSRAVELVVSHLDPVRLLFGGVIARTVAAEGWSIAGIAFAAVWAVAAVASLRVGPASLRHLHTVLGLALVLEVVAASRIVGAPWEWLLLWVWVVAAWMLMAVAWTASEVVRVRRPAVANDRRVQLVATALLATVAMAVSAFFTVDAAHVKSDGEASVALGNMAPEILRHLDQRRARGEDRYIIQWDDPIGVIGTAYGYAVADELLRHGHRVRLGESEHLRAAPYLTEGRATATLVIVIGPAIAEWERRPDATKLAIHDPRPQAAREAQPELRRQVERGLREGGRADLAELLDHSFIGALFAAGEDPDLPRSLMRLMDRYISSEHATAVFLVDEP